MEPRTKIARLRELMRRNQIDAWIVPSADPHQSEYVADCWQARAWLSGFSGSAGTVVVTQDACGLWTDFRYHIRAAQELEGSGIELYRSGLPGVPSHTEWLAQELPDGATVGFDGRVLSVGRVADLRQALAGKAVTLSYEHDLVGALWHDRPAVPRNPLVLHDLAHAGETRQSKFQRVRDKLKQEGAQAQAMALLDEIAWLFNIRGSDVRHNPVAICYAAITEAEVRLFIHQDKVPVAVREALEADGVQVSAYEDTFSFWQGMPEGTTVLLDPARTSYRLERTISESCRVLERPSIPYTLKAIKNETELEGIRAAHLRDGVAVVKWLCWLDGLDWETEHTEVTLAEELAAFRAQGECFQGLSFDTIAGYEANSAVGHYRPRPETTPTIRPEGILLVDSGGQYLDGTTDITRTITLGAPTQEERRIFTYVLKALIKLSRAKFPEGTRGSALDALAREPFWEQGLDCRHGIGHGIGAYLNVHEGPQRLSKTGDVALEAGMVTTIEPGVYFEGRFGVRLENVVITVPAKTTEFGAFYRFETVTLCPIDLDLVEASMLSPEERTWLNAYHRRVEEVLSPHLSPAEGAWLHHETREI